MLCDELLKRFSGVTQATAIQERVIQIAKGFVNARNQGSVADKRDYLIITTNYDPLLEMRLEQERVPTCLVTVKWKTFEVVAEVLPHTQAALNLDDGAFQALKRGTKRTTAYSAAAMPSSTPALRAGDGAGRSPRISSWRTRSTRS